MVSSGHSISCWRSFKKGPIGSDFAGVDRLLENVLRLPEAENLVLDRWQVDLWGKYAWRARLRHGPSLSCVSQTAFGARIPLLPRMRVELVKKSCSGRASKN